MKGRGREEKSIPDRGNKICQVPEVGGTGTSQEMEGCRGQ